jgi:hypothetical protein
MWRRLRGLLTGLALAGLTGISLVAAGQIVWQGIEGAGIVQRPYEFARLYDEDLAFAPDAAQQEFLRGLERDFDSAGDWQARLESLDEVQRRRFEANMTLLAERWFNSKVDRYFELPAGERDAYIDSLFKQLEQWGQTAADAGGPGDRAGDAARTRLAALGPIVVTRAGEWLERAPPERQEQIREFQSAVQTRLLLRAFEDAGNL